MVEDQSAATRQEFHVPCLTDELPVVVIRKTLGDRGLILLKVFTYFLGKSGLAMEGVNSFYDFLRVFITIPV